MMNSTLEQELQGYLNVLPEGEQRRVLDYARNMATAVNAPRRPPGVSGAELLASLTAVPPLTDEEAAQMERDIEDGMGIVDASTWERATFAE